MDLVTLVATCALTVDPKLMHALIWHQSGGEPWSFSVPGQRQPQVYRSAREAVHEAHEVRATDLPIRIGLTGLAADSGSATLALFMPCPNITMAARQIVQLVDRCKVVPRFTADPMHCAIAAYRGSWDRPDNKFADAVLASVAKGDAPNFDMPDELDERSSDEGRQPSVAGKHVSTPSPASPDDQRQGWLSALFPTKSQQLGHLVTSKNSSGPSADGLQESSQFTAHPMTPGSHDNGLFVRRLPERRPQ
jgi:hypothetical protein